MSFSGCANIFLPTQNHSKFSSWRHHNTCSENVESFEPLLHNDNFPTSDDLAVPSIESNEREWLLVSLELSSGFRSYW